ncbi:MAG: ATP-dependent serine peptidase containing a PDZ domain protein [Microbacterium sp. 71-36]|uniref:YlbL family protein n=1 Tax=unclassified Microbacterium TaxID=2609290 RepID=UPI00086AE339|nr:MULTISPECIES: S16 family serine protease [unclassified Microbacterium]MBN9213081.1 PDZ domain-containing protein [Microbacterium sp.]ODT40909.1 MAG: ATP-dependent serine peptidase containing a PDZ domain protein [Microbacterium sp. SCN 71-17]OJV78329.1 MAG: ATP-dependent serine peptidase containing a PDZ domain protein [Microbacterium sp. 71-36]
MTLFDENVSVVPAPRRRWSRSTVFGAWSLVVATLVLLVLSFLPSPYVIQQPGPVLNTLGTSPDADGNEVPLITVPDEKDTPSAGQLDLLTVQINGNRERTPSWIELAQAWFDPSRAVVPLDRIFPSGQSTEQRNTENAALMSDSQLEASAAALRQLGYTVPQDVVVGTIDDSGASAGVLRLGDVITALDGAPVASVADIRSAVQAGGGAPVELGIERDGAQSSVSVTPRLTDVDGQQQWLLGVGLTLNFDLPVDVKIQINNVGGPSAGMMFALGIIDKMSTGDLTGGQHIAGTGTIDADGNVGGIGGIRQKLYGARNAGATWFLAPQSNCNEVVGHVPDGIRVFSVSTLQDSLTALETIRDGGDLDALPTCDGTPASGS